MAADQAMESDCPLCGGKRTDVYLTDKARQYDICRDCALVFVPARFHPGAAAEKARYDSHNNHPDDPGYRKFLNRLFAPLCERLPEAACGLDFGCGPGPALAAMFREKGFSIDLHDKFYAANPAVFSRTYDFITATEVLEHLQQPGLELARLFEMLKDGGMLGVMTKLAKDRRAFENWHYKRDPTHICFFSVPTFEWLADAWQARIEFVAKDAVLIHKRAAAAGNGTGP